MQKHIQGAKWWKFDFHNHTPASDDFGKGPDQAALKQMTPREWLILYMAAGIDCVAVTDHNSGEWIDKLKAELVTMDNEKPAGYRPLVLFPGVEITINGNIHVLALFDPSATTGTIDGLLGAVGYPLDKKGTSEAVTTDSLEVALDKINDKGAVAIPAHVDKACGLFEKVAGNTLKQMLQTEGLLAIELIDPNFAKPDIYNQAKLQLAEVVGTDSHLPAQVGTNYTWIKMSVPSLEALKLALHDGKDAVLRKDQCEDDPNAIENRFFIKSVKITNAQKAGNGNPLEANFSPWLTSIIGGRGSGKSSIINFLRIVFDKQSEMPTNIQDDFDKFKQKGSRVSPGMLRDQTKITAEIIKDGKHYKIEWNFEPHNYSVCEWNETATAWTEPVNITNIADLFPVQIFSQKELFSLTDNPAKLIDLIDSQFEKKNWAETKNEQEQKWLQLRAKARGLKAAITEEPNLRVELEAILTKIALFESSAFKDILSGYNDSVRITGVINRNKNTLLEYITDLKEVHEKFPVFQVPTDLEAKLDAETLAYIVALNASLALAKTDINNALQKLAPIETNIDTELNALPWKTKHDEDKTAYDGIAPDIQAMGSDTYETLLAKKEVVEQKLSVIEQQKAELTTTDAELNITYAAIIEHQKELRTKRDTVIKKWAQFDSADKPLMVIELEPMADTDSANASFRALIRKSGEEFSKYIFAEAENIQDNSGIIHDLSSEHKDTRWDKRKELVEKLISISEDDPKGFDKRFARHIDQLRTSTPEDIDRLMVWFPEDKISLKYRKGDTIQDIQSGSAGERTAGMLALLLALNNEPLIIDQPEDDLDTRLISSFVVEGFRKLKANRQIILVTHNPNIAVNGNSENVIHMDYISGQIAVQANNALQDKKVRTAVCDVMEGGRAALNSRYYRISKALA